jgi:DNA-binding transcriptional LysR family regulator
VEYRSFTLAAKKVHITQSAMSKRIRKMERELDKRLFILDGARVVLTDAAKQLIPYARQMLAAHGNMLKTLNESSDESPHHLLIGASVYVSHYILPGFLNYLQSMKCLIHGHIKTVSEKTIENDLNHSVVDLILCPEQEIPENVIFKCKLWEEQLNWVVSSDHPLAEMNEPLSLTTLSEHPGIFSERGAAIRDKVEVLFRENNLRLNLSNEVSIIDAIKGLVEHGIGWSLLPNSLLTEKLTILNIKGIEIVLSFYVYVLTKRVEEPAIQEFLKSFASWKKSK